MIVIDWSALVLGGASGLVMGVLFFLGLALGMRLALRSESPVKLLALSAALRIAALLGVAWVVVGQGGPWAAPGYALAFLVVRIIATTIARVGAPAGRAS
jgi:hypothetical protein